MKEVFEMFLPGLMYFWVLFVGQGPMQEVLNEKGIHTLSRILVAPVSLPQFVLSKIIRCFLLCGLIQTLLLLASSLLFGVRWGNPFTLAMVIATSALSMSGLLAFIYSLARTSDQANLLSTIALLICAMLGGSMFPFEQLPGFMQAIGRFTPNHWGIVAFQQVLRARPVGELIAPVAALAALGVVGAAVGYHMFQRQLQPSK